MDHGVFRALVKALQGVPVTPADEAVVTLAKRYAETIDSSADPKTLGELGPRLLSCLVELRMTPRARVAVARGGAPSAPTGVSPLAAVRERRAGARPNGTASMDTSAS